MTAVVDTDPVPAPGIRAGAFGNATNLVCRECGASTALGPFYACTECFGPLEVGYAFPT
ncbi:MAG TPA: threonine synthase, partial [Propionibacteriaceae bacterium]|nr:threonine synthase [Propionibacteriaceae bacterium]